jgi:hypothetical protein
MNIRPTDSAEPVWRKTRMPAARSVRAVPTVETSWAVHRRRKSRFRKTEKADGVATAAGAAWPLVRRSGAGSVVWLSRADVDVDRPPHCPSGARVYRSPG